MLTPFREEHDQFRKTVRQFAEKELAPYAAEWEKAEIFPNEVFKRAGERFEMPQVAEGIKTATSARDLAQKSKVEMPICEQVFLIAHEDKPAKQAVNDLMVRAQTAEF